MNVPFMQIMHDVSKRYLSVILTSIPIITQEKLWYSPNVRPNVPVGSFLKIGGSLTFHSPNESNQTYIWANNATWIAISRVYLSVTSTFTLY